MAHNHNRLEFYFAAEKYVKEAMKPVFDLGFFQLPKQPLTSHVYVLSVSSPSTSSFSSIHSQITSSNP
ncbi:hypothetical protein L6452_07737 [Arctium lappa]|uniref:Uncharacterized protein n=1 Tax=Arctium lappa TaxID=4217 RepID=A0ACB9ELP3_ARCLA|nr:hypothetical protein L6452_07737 [Arctium lappa]